MRLARLSTADKTRLASDKLQVVLVAISTRTCHCSIIGTVRLGVRLLFKCYFLSGLGWGCSLGTRGGGGNSNAFCLSRGRRRRVRIDRRGRNRASRSCVCTIGVCWSGFAKALSGGLRRRLLSAVGRCVGIRINACPTPRTDRAYQRAAHSQYSCSLNQAHLMSNNLMPASRESASG
jgi:hypothetical protein